MGHPKTQTMQTADCRPGRPCRLCRPCRLSNFFLTLDSFFSVLQVQNIVKYLVMFVIYPQTMQTQHLTIDSIDKRVKYTLYGKFPLLVINILKSSIKLNFHVSWAQIASIFDRFVVLILLSNLFLLSCSFFFSISLFFLVSVNLLTDS